MIIIDFCKLCLKSREIIQKLKVSFAHFETIVFTEHYSPHIDGFYAIDWLNRWNLKLITMAMHKKQLITIGFNINIWCILKHVNVTKKNQKKMWFHWQFSIGKNCIRLLDNVYSLCTYSFEQSKTIKQFDGHYKTFPVLNREQNFHHVGFPKYSPVYFSSITFQRYYSR